MQTITSSITYRICPGERKTRVPSAEINERLTCTFHVGSTRSTHVQLVSGRETKTYSETQAGRAKTERILQTMQQLVSRITIQIKWKPPNNIRSRDATSEMCQSRDVQYSSCSCWKQHLLMAYSLSHLLTSVTQTMRWSQLPDIINAASSTTANYRECTKKTPSPSQKHFAI